MALSGGVNYQASGSLISGDFTVGKRGGKTAYVRGAGSIVGPTEGSARVAIRLDRASFLGLWFGQVSVTDRASGVNTVAAYIGVPSVNGTTVSGTAFSLHTSSGPPFVTPVRVAWSVTDAG